MNQLKIRSHISPCTQKVRRPFPISDMFLVLMKQPLGGDGLPPSFTVKPLTDPDRQLSLIKPALHQLFIKTQYIRKRLPFRIPPHVKALLFHRLCLDKEKIPSPLLIAGFAKGDLMMIDIIG